jgi:WD40 repeat protein
LNLGITYAVVYSPNGQSLALGMPNGVSLYRADLSERVWASEVEGSLTECVAFSPDGATLASGSTGISGAEGDDVILWDAATGKQIRIFEGHREGVVNVAFSPDGSMLASGASDGTVMLWNATTGERVHVLKGHTREVSGIAFLPNGVTLASGAFWDETAILWDTETGEQAHALDCDSFRVYSPDGTTMACTPGKGIVLWDTATRNPVRVFEEESFHIWASAAFSSDGTLLAAGEYWDDTIILWDTTTGEQVRALKGYTTTVSSMAFSPDGTTLASAARDGTVTLWDVAR